MNIPLSKPDISELEIAYVTRVLRGSELSLGPRLGEFEEKFAAHVGTRYTVATSSGTAALHLCVRALGIGPEDEVITSSFSFVASANCLLYERALPVFVDIDADTLNIDPAEIRKFLQHRCTLNAHKDALVDKQTGRTVKGILPIHVFGVPCEMDSILELADEYNLSIIEDACEALGGEYHGRRVGTFGDAGVFAFYPNKQMTTAEGGMIVTNDQRIADLCRSLRNQGRDADCGWLRHVRLGFNYRLSELHCALGLAQLERIDELLDARERVAAVYNRILAGNPLLKLPAQPPSTKCGWFVYVIQLLGPSPRRLRDQLLLQLREQGVGCQAYFPAIHQQPYFQEYDATTYHPLTRTESASDRCLALPFFSELSESQITYVCDVLLKALETQAATPVPEAGPDTKRSRSPLREFAAPLLERKILEGQ